MGRPSKGFPVHKLLIAIPMDLKERMDELLFDNDVGRVRSGSYQNFIIAVLSRELRASEAKVKILQETSNG